MFPYNNKKYLIDIVEAKPSNGISIIETDCEVDFAPPLDYKEPVAAAAAKGQVKAEEVAVAEPESKLDDLLSYESPPVAANSNGQSHSVASSSGSEKAARQAQGKLVFGSNVNQSTKEITKVGVGKDKKQEKEGEKDKFQAFSGKKYIH